ncbi:hypothetical protein [Parenemella sanctibonifatiensis]|uniref:Uncharacterized protein n=1 Tax=Parenemella sanctibonifatiensis TaxID=2016505 RepID=A0A255E4F5_9ACTN|nr:hypothetical protein [Parenemella sanctibonifatiensis]OYN86467.1 hypothetical protein CGZ92_08950 [Parenemella sanctibonifatiensis]
MTRTVEMFDRYGHEVDAEPSPEGFLELDDQVAEVGADQDRRDVFMTDSDAWNLNVNPDAITLEDVEGDGEQWELRDLDRDLGAAPHWPHPPYVLPMAADVALALATAVREQLVLRPGGVNGALWRSPRTPRSRTPSTPPSATGRWWTPPTSSSPQRERLRDAGEKLGPWT